MNYGQFMQRNTVCEKIQKYIKIRAYRIIFSQMSYHCTPLQNEL